MIRTGIISLTVWVISSPRPKPFVALERSATELSKKLGVSQPSVSISVNRGEKIAKAEQLELVED